eukprot:3831035-Lingulodinium_polyedra.AAC.1
MRTFLARATWVGHRGAGAQAVLRAVYGRGVPRNDVAAVQGRDLDCRRGEVHGGRRPRRPRE